MSPKNPTMNDVAREAGVALKTVSRYINGATNIHPELAERIGAAVQKLGYRRNLAAASIRPGWTSRMIGVVIGDISNPYYSALLQSIELTARAEGYFVISASAEEQPELFATLVGRLLDHRVDGLIVVPPAGVTDVADEVVNGTVPVVSVDRPLPIATEPDTFLADNRGGAAEAAAALLAQDARRPAFVGDSLDLFTMQERLAGFRSALATAGIPLPDDLIFTTAHDPLQSEEAVAAALDRGADALFAANNRVALGALAAFTARGTRVPMVAFDDFEGSAFTYPPVSVVTHDVREMGRLAVEAVLRRLRGDAEAPATSILPTQLVLRGSERVG